DFLGYENSCIIRQIFSVPNYSLEASLHFVNNSLHCYRGVIFQKRLMHFIFADAAANGICHRSFQIAAPKEARVFLSGDSGLILLRFWSLDSIKFAQTAIWERIASIAPFFASKAATLLSNRATLLIAHISRWRTYSSAGNALPHN